MVLTAVQYATEEWMRFWSDMKKKTCNIRPMAIEPRSLVIIHPVPNPNNAIMVLPQRLPIEIHAFIQYSNPNRLKLVLGLLGLPTDEDEVAAPLSTNVYSLLRRFTIVQNLNRRQWALTTACKAPIPRACGFVFCWRCGGQISFI